MNYETFKGEDYSPIEVHIGDRVFVSFEGELDVPIQTQMVFPDEYGFLKFLTNKKFCEFKEDGPEELSRKEIVQIFFDHLQISREFK